MRKSLRCGSCLAYATSDTTPLARRLQRLIIDIKLDRLDPESNRAYVDLVVERLTPRLTEEVRSLFSAPVTLVPVPGSGLTKPNTVWPALNLCNALIRFGLGSDVSPVLKRITAVPKSAGNVHRPGVHEHAKSFVVTPGLEPPARLLLVDDIVTKGSTLMAAAWMLEEAFPGIQIDAFALARVQSSGAVEQVVQPEIELIKVGRYGCWRPKGTIARG